MSHLHNPYELQCIAAERRGNDWMISIRVTSTCRVIAALSEMRAAVEDAIATREYYVRGDHQPVWGREHLCNGRKHSHAFSDIAVLCVGFPAKWLRHPGVADLEWNFDDTCTPICSMLVIDDLVAILESAEVDSGWFKEHTLAHRYEWLSDVAYIVHDMELAQFTIPEWISSSELLVWKDLLVRSENMTPDERLTAGMARLRTRLQE